MRKTIIYSCVIAFVLSLQIPAFAQANNVSEYLCEIGKIYYYQGKNDEALHEFKKALAADSDNALAKFYVEKIEGSRKDAWDKTLDEFDSKGKKLPLQSKEERETVPPEGIITKDAVSADKTIDKFSKVDISGEARVALGSTSEGFEWKRANGDLNERNWRVISNAALNNYENTFDPRIFDRVRVDIDTKNTEAFGAHANITVDPWSFTGKSEKITVTASDSDFAEIELKYWSNTRRTINETIFTLDKGDAFSLPEIKVEDDRTQPVSAKGGFPGAGTFNVPSLKIQREFQPLRELWFDYRTDNSKIRFFPIAYSDQALTSDDPLGLSNHHIYWEESPWILRWSPGHINTVPNPDDFSQGKWDDTLAFFTRDSDLTRLTSLRGVAFDYQPTDETSFNITGASPKGLWQDYDSFDNFPAAMRLKQRIGDMLELGTIYTYRLGLNEAQKNRKDALNHTWGTDFGFSPFTGIKLQGEIAASRSEQDLTSSFATKKRGLAYQLSLLGSPEKDILSSNYDEIKPQRTDWSFLKTRLQFTHMDKGFEPALATYRETRDDQFWSRHIHFRKPFKYVSTDSGSLSLDDVMPFAIGDGIDTGRDVVALRVESSMLDRRLDELFDVRNVHKSGGKYLENVARSETTFKATEKLTAKLLAIYHNVHQTYGAKDPFLVDSTDRVVDNSIIPDSKSASMKTFSLGANYDFFDWLSTYGIWEYSNDINAAYDAFPRGILNSGSFDTFSGFGRTFRHQTTFLYNQYYFPLPPYPFNNTFKAGLSLRPHEKWELFLDFTRNEYEYAGQVSDDINHIGLEISYQPTEKLGFLAKYVFSQVNDLVTMNNGKNVGYEEHNNFFVEARYNFSDDEGMTFQFGEAGRSPVATVSYDPFGGSLSVLDTQHIYRASYRRRF